MKSDIQQQILTTAAQAVERLYGTPVPEGMLILSPTRKEFAGHFTLVCFPLTKFSRLSPPLTGEAIGRELLEILSDIVDFNVIQGFLNLVVSDEYWVSFLETIEANKDFGRHERNDIPVMVEFSSPNTNKPLHLGHVRNILLGWSCSRMLDNAGYTITRSQVINDRGIAICKSMLAWQLFADGQTPQSTGIKPDHFVGDWYVRFEQAFKVEYSQWQTTAEAQALASEHKDGPFAFFGEFKNNYFNKFSPMGQKARTMLLAWEAGDPEVKALWLQMNNWVYEGFNATYDRLGVVFDRIYYESETYLLGKDLLTEGLDKGIFYRKDDTSVWIDLTEEKLDHKLLLRSDGTSVYITQDLGMARWRYDEYKMQRSLYVVADEQDYHFKVLFATLAKLGEPYAGGLHHLSYGMVELPTGRMKSREGTVVDADDLLDEVSALARKESDLRGELADSSEELRQATAMRVGLGALKYYILKVNPRKKMIFDPEGSLDLQGHTGPYIQYAYVRSLNVLRKDTDKPAAQDGSTYTTLHEAELTLLQSMYAYPEITRLAAESYDPAILANHLYDLAKTFNRMYHEVRILQAETEAARAFRLRLSAATAQILLHGMELIGIPMPERM
jgi:arginyl-tRNA synthetase